MNIMRVLERKPLKLSGRGKPSVMKNEEGEKGRPRIGHNICQRPREEEERMCRGQDGNSIGKAVLVPRRLGDHMFTGINVDKYL